MQLYMMETPRRSEPRSDWDHGPYSLRTENFSGSLPTFGRSMITTVDWNQLIADAEAGLDSFSDLESNKHSSFASSNSADLTRSILTFNTNIDTTTSSHPTKGAFDFDDAVFGKAGPIDSESLPPVMDLTVESQNENIDGNGNMSNVGNDESLPLCKCLNKSVKRMVKKEGKNQGRFFYVCSKDKEHQCGFFEWMQPKGFQPFHPSQA